MLYMKCSDCEKEMQLEKDAIFYCNDCNREICRSCFLDGDGLCESCCTEEL